MPKSLMGEMFGAKIFFKRSRSRRGSSVSRNSLKMPVKKSLMSFENAHNSSRRRSPYAHFSCQILAGHKSREDALEEIKKPLWAPGELEPAIDFACRKLGFSASEWNTIMKAAPLPHSHYPTDWAFQKNSHPMYQYFRRMATGRNQR